MSIYVVFVDCDVGNGPPAAFKTIESAQKYIRDLDQGLGIYEIAYAIAELEVGE